VHPSIVRVAHILRDAGAIGEPVQLADSTRTAAQAAAALGCDVGAIASSLLFLADGEPLLVLTSGAHRVDTAHVAQLLRVSKVTMADADTVRAATGFAIGGVAPVGHPQPLRTLVDAMLADHEVVWAAAGHPHAVFPTSYDELVGLTGGEPVQVVP
jgi:prolyl-tRNA editing enzyme YbaK/EbsC (Cys-tRNA(Pro) deacylase)